MDLSNELLGKKVRTLLEVTQQELAKSKNTYNRVSTNYEAGKGISLPKIQFVEKLIRETQLNSTIEKH